MKCVIIEDELLAQEVLEHYISKVPGLKLLAKYNNAIDFIKHYQSLEKIDLVFLDINMPEVSGLDLLKMIKDLPDVILTTAFQNFALEAYSLDVKDYLTKPFSFDRFMQGIHKTSLFKNENVSGIAQTTDDSFYVKSDKRLIKILYADIIYIEANRNNLSLIIENHPKIIIHATLGNMENTLSNCSFMIRVHRSFSINKNKIIQILGNEILFNENITVPIGALYKEEFFKSIKVL